MSTTDDGGRGDGRPLRICILDNDHLDPAVADTYVSYGVMVERMFAAAGRRWCFDRFDTMQQQYPASFDDYDAVLLTGSRADSFGDAPWIVALRARVATLLREGRTLLGICFGHQLIAHVLGAPVGRAPQGWGMGRMTYEWVGPDPLPPGSSTSTSTSTSPTSSPATLSLLAAHQDQVAQLPAGATLLARSDFCPVAAYRIDDRVLCVQPHPEFDEAYSAYLIDKRRALLGDEAHARARAALAAGHDGLAVARLMQAFVEARVDRGSMAAPA